MIVARAPLRISFVGGGTDLPEFYTRHPGRVISTAIDKYVFLAINRTPFIEKVSARYSVVETVDRPEDLQHTRLRAALVDLDIRSKIEIGSFASLPARTGLGSSSSFSVALLAGLYSYLGKSLEPGHLAELASRLEIELVGERIGKQDQYAAAFGGLHVYQFNHDGTVDVQPVALTVPLRRKLEYHMLLFYTGITRSAAAVLDNQRAHMDGHFELMKQMAADVEVFERMLCRGDVEGMGNLLHENWMRKRQLSGMISSGVIDHIYNAGMGAGAWGGKLLGAGGGGCVLFLAPAERHDEIRQALKEQATKLELTDSCEIHLSLVTGGASVVYNGDVLA